MLNQDIQPDLEVHVTKLLDHVALLLQTKPELRKRASNRRLDTPGIVREYIPDAFAWVVEHPDGECALYSHTELEPRNPEWTAPADCPSCSAQFDTNVTLTLLPDGIKPRFRVEQRRAKEILAAMQRYVEAGIPFDRDWLEELGEINGRMKMPQATVNIHP